VRQEKSARDSHARGLRRTSRCRCADARISRLSPSDEKWKAKFAVLKENVEHHVEEEEGEIWTKAQEVFDEAEAEKLGEAFVAEKERRMAKIG
jgi:hypothetical protein